MIIELSGYVPDWRIIVKVDHQEVANKIFILYSKFNLKVIQADNINILVTENLEIQFGIQHRKAKNINEAVFIVYEAVDYITKNGTYPVYMLHGGSILFNENVYGFIAKSHAGKSTMLAELAMLGGDLLSDDTIFFDEKYFVYPFPSPLRLRSLDIISDCSKFKILHTGVHPISMEVEWLIEINSTYNNLSKLTALFLLDRTDDVRPNLFKQNMISSFKTIIENGKTTDISMIKKINLLALSTIKEIPVYTLKYGSLSSGIEIIIRYNN